MPGARTARTREIDRYIGSRLPQRRVMLGLTQRELGRKVGLAFQQIERYELGADRISASRLFDCAVALQMPFGWFVEGATSALRRAANGQHAGNLALHRAMNRIADPGCRRASPRRRRDIFAPTATQTTLDQARRNADRAMPARRPPVVTRIPDIQFCGVFLLSFSRENAWLSYVVRLLLAVMAASKTAERDNASILFNGPRPGTAGCSCAT